MRGISDMLHKHFSESQLSSQTFSLFIQNEQFQSKSSYTSSHLWSLSLSTHQFSISVEIIPLFPCFRFIGSFYSRSLLLLYLCHLYCKVFPNPGLGDFIWSDDGRWAQWALAWALDLTNTRLFLPTPLKEWGIREWPGLLWEAEQPSLGRISLRWGTSGGQGLCPQNQLHSESIWAVWRPIQLCHVEVHVSWISGFDSCQPWLSPYTFLHCIHNWAVAYWIAVAMPASLQEKNISQIYILYFKPYYGVEICDKKVQFGGLN